MKLFNAHHISYQLDMTKQVVPGRMARMDITDEKVRFMMSLFRGRTDAFSKRSGKPNAKTGKIGYYTQCMNYGKRGICPKYSGISIKCQDCAHQQYTPLQPNFIKAHLIGRKENCSDVIGIYPLLPDQTCWLLVFDFDDHEQTGTDPWKEEVRALRQTCDQMKFDYLVARSRSGNGAHVWFFFKEALEAHLARRFGSYLLNKAQELVDFKTFRTYDRMLPAQDRLAEGMVGNVIALPLQGQDVKKGNSVFVDENWQTYYDQWAVLENVQRISKEAIEKVIQEQPIISDFGTLCPTEEESKPWIKSTIFFKKEDVQGEVHITLADLAYIHIDELSIAMRNRIRRMVSFHNSEFYKLQAMGFSTAEKPRIISGAQTFEHHIGIPRGTLAQFVELLEDAGISYQIEDLRERGKAIHVDFIGQLYPPQQEAANALLAVDIGILAASTAFGKTIVGTYLVASRGVNALILVHTREILQQWKDSLEHFLDIYEDLPTYKTPTGRIKKRDSCIGELYSGQNKLTGIVDVAMISSLLKNGEVLPEIKQYGMVIMDECHHAPAPRNERVLNEVNAYYVYGLTATPYRDDGLKKRIFMQFGPIRYHCTAKDRARDQGIGHYVYPRFTLVTDIGNEKKNYNESVKYICENERRLQMIIDDVKNCIQAGRTPLVLSHYKDYARRLYDNLIGVDDHLILLEGGRSNTERKAIRKQMDDIPDDQTVIVVAINKYVGEGFNYPRLDTMMLTTPFRFEGNWEQYAGRLNLDYIGKKDVVIYDYVDCHMAMFNRMYHQRMKIYKKIGYKLLQPDRPKQELT